MGALPSMGVVSNSFNDTCRPVESGKVNSGTFWPTCGAPVDGGSQRAKTKYEKRNSAIIATLSVAKIDVMIFERVG